MTGWLAALARGAPVDGPVALVAAHPDDEVLGLGSRLCLFRDLTIIHLTDGAPRDGLDARRAGFGGCEDYAAARRAELARALAAAGARPRCLGYGHPDQEAIRHCREIAGRLAHDLKGMRAVITHPYEHGHPDHDSAALAVSLACRRLQEAGRAPVRYEFASYHLRGAQPGVGVFWPDPGTAEIELPVSDDQLGRKRAAIACFATQASVIAAFPLAPERVRRAPGYDFRAAAPPGEALYDRWGIAMTSAEWRRLAADVLDRVGAGEPA